MRPNCAGAPRHENELRRRPRHAPGRTHAGFLPAATSQLKGLSASPPAPPGTRGAPVLSSHPSSMPCSAVQARPHTLKVAHREGAWHRQHGRVAHAAPHAPHLCHLVRERRAPEAAHGPGVGQRGQAHREGAAVVLLQDAQRKVSQFGRLVAHDAPERHRRGRGGGRAGTQTIRDWPPGGEAHDTRQGVLTAVLHPCVRTRAPTGQSASLPILCTCPAYAPVRAGLVIELAGLQAVERRLARGVPHARQHLAAAVHQHALQRGQVKALGRHGDLRRGQRARVCVCTHKSSARETSRVCCCAAWRGVAGRPPQVQCASSSRLARTWGTSVIHELTSTRMTKSASSLVCRDHRSCARPHAHAVNAARLELALGLGGSKHAGGGPPASDTNPHCTDLQGGPDLCRLGRTAPGQQLAQRLVHGGGRLPVRQSTPRQGLVTTSPCLRGPLARTLTSHLCAPVACAP